MMNDNCYSNRSWDGYEVPASGTYTDLTLSSENYRQYEDLKLPKEQQKNGGNIRVIVTVLCVITSALFVALICTIIYFLRNLDNVSICERKDCGNGKCYLNSDGKAVCVCPHGRTGDRCELSEFRVSEVRAHCPPDWSTFNTWCYKQYSDKKTWLQARDFCRSMGADLLSIHNENENGFLIGHFPTGHYWIGFHVDKNNDFFKWSDGSLMNYTNWNANEPNDFNQNEKCVHFDADVGGKWNDNNCFMSFEYICKMNRTSECGSGSWLLYNGSCYLLSPLIGSNSSVNWNEARRICQNNGADLTNIQSRNEYRFLLSQATKSSSELLWIGLNDRERRGDYRWTDNTTPSFLSWNIGEPNNDNDRCVGLLSVYGNWADSNCNNAHGYICEKVLI